MELEVKLTVEEINAILQVLGQTPTNSGLYPLLVKIKQQAEEAAQKASNAS
jgi:hypothetical protein